MEKKIFEIELLKSVDESFENEFYKFSKTLEFSKGASPFMPETLLKYFYIVLEGRIKTYQVNFETAKEQTIFVYQRGDMFDVISLLDEEPHEVIYEVLEDCRVLEFPIETVRHWVNTNPTFNKIFFPYLANKMRYTEELATELSLFDVKERLSYLLVQNSNPKNKFRYKLLQNLPNSEIAKLIGTVRHVVERIFKQFKSEKIIQTQRKQIKIIDFKKLLEKSKKMLPK